MRELLKKMRGYLIYNGFFFLMLLLGYCLEPGRFVGQDCDWIWLWLVPSVYVLAFELYLAGTVPWFIKNMNSPQKRSSCPPWSSWLRRFFLWEFRQF